jgi:hypothetical protein
MWSRVRHELFYVANNRIMVAPYTVEEDSFKVEKPWVWTEQTINPTTGSRSFDLHPDGERFVALKIFLVQRSSSSCIP